MIVTSITGIDNNLLLISVVSFEMSIPLSTIYRNLTAMIEKGLIGHVSVPSGSARFDKSAVSHPHGQCPLCGEVYDIPAEEIDVALEKTLGRHANSYQLTVSYPCEKCAEAVK